MFPGRTRSFVFLKFELWWCWRVCCGCYYADHLVDRDKGDEVCCRPAFETDSRYYRGDLCYASYTTIVSVVLGEFFP